MHLSELITTLEIQIEPNERWSLFGPEAEAFGSKLRSEQANLLPFSQKVITQLNGLLLAGALSAMSNSQGWLKQITGAMTEGANLVVIDWQGDGPLDYGPDLELRFKKGRVRRLLREDGFGTVDTLDDHPLYYIIKGTKGPAPPLPHANEWVEVANLDELPKNAMKKVELFKHKIIVANTGKEIVAFARACPHANGPFDKGILRGRNVVCPLHGYIWNVCNGQPVEPVDEDTLPRYRVRVDPERRRVLVALAPVD